MINLGWIAASFVWVMGMWLAFRVNQAIVEIEYREAMNNDRGFFMLVCLYSVVTILLWPVVQLFAIQRAVVHFGESEEEE